jgi:hypothetical protein
MMEKMMESMAGKMSPEDKKAMMAALLDKVVAGMSTEEKQEALVAVVAKMIEGMDKMALMTRMMEGMMK